MWGWLKINLGISGTEQMRQKSQIPQMELKSILGSNVCLSTNRELIRGFIWNSSNSASLVSKVEPALPDWRFVQLVFLFETLNERASFLCLSLDCPNAYLEQEAFHVWRWAKEIENYKDEKPSFIRSVKPYTLTPSAFNNTLTKSVCSRDGGKVFLVQQGH